MQFLPESFTKDLSTALIPRTQSNSAMIRAIEPSFNQNAIAKRDAAFDSQLLFNQHFNFGNTVQSVIHDSRSIAQLFVTHDLCWTCINEKTSAQYGAKLEVVSQTANDTQVLTEHPFLTLMQSVNDNMHEQDLYEAWTVHQNLWGKFTCLLIRDKSFDDLANPSGKVIGIMPIRPDQLETRIVNKQVKYIFRPNSFGVGKEISPDSLMFDVFYNPLASQRGASPTSVAARWLCLDTMTTDTNSAFLQGGGLPGLIMMLETTLPDANRTPKTAQTIQTELKLNKEAWDAQYKRGGLRERKPAFTAGMTPFIIPNAMEAQILDSYYNRIESRVAGIYGVPPHRFQVGLEHGDSRANSENADTNFAERIIYTQLERIRMKLQTSACFTDYAQKGEFLRWNLSGCKIFHYQEIERKTSLRNDFKAGFIAADYISAELGYPIPPVSVQGKTFYEIQALSRPIPNSTNPNKKNLDKPNG